MHKIISISLLWILYFPIGSNVLFAQGNIIAVMEINGRIVERTDNVRKGVPGLQIKVEHHQLSTNEEGRFDVKVPIYKKDLSKSTLSLGIQSPDYQIVHPLDGKIEIDTASYVLSIEIFVCGQNFDWESRQRIEQQQNQIRKLKRKNGLTQNRLNALNQLMLDTILFYEHQRLIQKEEIAGLKKELADAENVNDLLQKQVDDLEQALNRSQSENQRITTQLFEAREEQYLRQQEYFEKISKDLNEYLIRVKDMWNLLPKVKQYFGGDQALAQNYINTVKSYEPAFLQINNSRDDYLQGVTHNWESKQLRSDLENTFDLLIQEVHHKYIKVPFNTINQHLASRNIGKAKKVGKQAYEDLSPWIIQAEQAIKNTIYQLEKNI